jgi:peroxiredoxin
MDRGFPAFILLLGVVGLLGVACAPVASVAVPSTPTPAIRLVTAAPTPAPPSAIPASPTAVRVGPKRGNIAPDFTLPDLNGDPVSLSDLRGQVVLINFWATWCPPCRAELPAIEAQYQSAADLVVLGVNFQEDVAAVGPFVEEQQLSFPILLDESGQVVMEYQARGLPSSVFVAPDGIISAVHLGPMDEDQVAGYVARARGE